jgi:cytochrome c biogenesis protein CcmG/thiol:disulfide interchange protein DsbE
MTLRLAVGVLLALSLIGCTSKHTGEIDRLRMAADLDPCPTIPSSDAGAKLPDLTLGCLGDGPRVRLQGLRGVPTLINVWGSWCAPCQREVPELQSVYAAAHERYRLIGVDTEDDHASALDFAAHVAMKYPSVVDDDGTFIRALGRKATPMTLFVDASGAVVHTKLGEFKNLADIKAQMHRYLGITV